MPQNPPTAARQRRLERDTNPASGAGQRAKLTADQLAEFSRLQRAGYARVGRSARVRECGEHPIVTGKVALGITEKGGVQVCGLARCGSRWCPECWGKVSAHRASELIRVVDWARKENYKMILVTLTAAHVADTVLEAAGGDLQVAIMQQSLSDLFDRLVAAWRYMASGRLGVDLKKSRIGYARAFELTLDGIDRRRLSGVHGHFHILLILRSDTDSKSYCEKFLAGWIRGCQRQDLSVSRSALDWKVLDLADPEVVQAAASYLTKGEKIGGEKIGAELVKSDVKSGFNGRVSPEGLLRAAAEAEEKDISVYAARWQAVEQACKGRRWLTWSRDLRKLAGVGVELSDEEIAGQEIPVEGDRVAVVRWSDVADHVDEIRQVVREAPLAKKKEETAWLTLVLCLDSLGVDYEISSYSDWSELVSHHMRARHLRVRQFE